MYKCLMKKKVVPTLGQEVKVQYSFQATVCFHVYHHQKKGQR